MENNKELYYVNNFMIREKPDEASNSLENQMVAMGKALIRAHKNLTKTEYKLLIMCLTKINWSKVEKTNEVELDKKEIAEILGLAQDDSLSQQLRKMFSNLALHSEIRFDKLDGNWDDGTLIINRRSTKGSILVRFNDYYMPLLSDLLRDKDFVTIWANDIYNFESKYSYLLFEELRLHSDTRCTNWRTYSTKQLKELFGIPKEGKGSYMRSETSGGFNRSEFEKKVLDVAIAEINKGQMMHVFPIVNSKEITKGKCYEKVKKNGYIVGYRFKYVVKTRMYSADAIADDNIPGQDSILDHPEWMPDNHREEK